MESTIYMEGTADRSALYIKEMKSLKRWLVKYRNWNFDTLEHDIINYVH